MMDMDKKFQRQKQLRYEIAELVESKFVERCAFWKVDERAGDSELLTQDLRMILHGTLSAYEIRRNLANQPVYPF